MDSGQGSRVRLPQLVVHFHTIQQCPETKDKEVDRQVETYTLGRRTYDKPVSRLVVECKTECA